MAEKTPDTRPGAPSADTPLNPGQRPAGVSFLMLVPAGFAIALLSAVGLLALKFGAGGIASGDRKVVQFAATCPDDAARDATVAHLRGRAEDIGMGQVELDASQGALRLTAVFPGLDNEDETLPAVLSAPGRFRLGPADAPVITHDDVEDASVNIDEGGDPYTQLLLLPPARVRLQAALDADPSGKMAMTVDGEALEDRPNSIEIDGESIRVPTGQALPRVRMQRAADRAIAISNGPLPCTLTPTDVALAEPSR